MQNTNGVILSNQQPQTVTGTSTGIQQDQNYPPNTNALQGPGYNETDKNVRMISCWSKLIMSKEMKLSAVIYNLCCKMSHVYELECTWLKFGQNILNECGMPYTCIWNTPTFINSNWIVNAVNLSLKDQFKQSWHTSMSQGSIRI